MNGYDFDGSNDFSVYNNDTVHNMYVDEFYNAGCCNVDDVTPDEKITADEANAAALVDLSVVPPHLRPFVDDCGDIDVAGLVSDCLRRCGYTDD